jgi:6-pyruvoyltetrahydropterin 2'-reductase|tara:strand:- start:881 stop:1717 length:837 start_codon:yes stop_codon:yes gene_type:complete
MEQIVLYSEIFRSIQGEGHYTGIPTVWLRFFGCNLECNGFGQTNPKDPSTYELPYEKIDLTEITSVEELPVFKYGCDSSYSWSKKFAKIQKKSTPEEVAINLQKLITSDQYHIAFTGGEPLLPAAQKNMVKIMEEFPLKRYNITIETNGTQQLKTEFHNYFQNYDKELFFSVSPKIHGTSGEVDAVKPEIIKTYHSLSDKGQLKFVCNGTDESWEEIEQAIVECRDLGITYPVWIMPVGALEETQKDNAAMIAEQTMDRGYNVSARVHCYIWGNQIGT